MIENEIEVGIGSRDYGYKRLAYGLPVSKVHYKKDIYIPWKFLRKNDPRLKNLYYFNPFSSTDIYHLWNGVCLNNKPWITSIESHMPRHPGYRRGFLHKLALEKLYSDNCRKILPFSQYTKKFILWQNEKNIDESLIDKMEVFYGGVPVDEKAVNEHAEFLRKEEQSFTVIFVGHLFFQKGGVPLLRAFKRLRNEIEELRLRIISKVAPDSYVTNVDPEIIEKTKREIREDNRIEWFESLPNEKVLEKMTSSHIGTLATLDDQFPWSPVESMSRGLPVIASNITSLTEQIKNGNNGYTINLPLHKNLKWQGLNYPSGSKKRKEEISNAYEILTEGLVKYIKELYYDREKLKEMSEAAVKHVRRLHDPANQAKKLERLYVEALR